MSDETSDWLELRRLRATPPPTVPASEHARFRASIEQAESYFTAAGVAGPSTSPVLTYYGFVQLAKAIELAGGITITNSHGLTCGRTSGNALATSVRVQGQCGHMMGVQLAIGDDPEPMPPCAIRDVIYGHPDLHDLFRDVCDGRPVELTKVRYKEPTFGRPLPRGPMTTRIMIAGPERGHEELQRIIRELPLPSGHEFARRVAPFDKQRPPRYGWGAELHWNDTQDAEGVWHVWDMVDITKWATPGPAVTTSGPLVIAPMSPAGTEWSRLSWWWPILFGLGNIARYSPEDWAKAVNLDTTPIAADVHELLRRARMMLPRLGLWALRAAQDRVERDQGSSSVDR